MDNSTPYTVKISNATTQEALNTGVVSDAANLASYDIANSTYKIYRVTDPAVLPPGMEIDYTDTANFTDVKASLNPTINANGELVFQLPNTPTDSYVVVMDGAIVGPDTAEAIAVKSTFGTVGQNSNGNLLDGSKYVFGIRFVNETATADVDSTAISESLSKSESTSISTASNSDTTTESNSKSQSDSVVSDSVV